VVLILARLIAACSTDDAEVHNAVRRAGVAHGRARARIACYTACMLAQEYAILRGHMWRALCEAHLHLSEGLLWLQAQIDVASIAALQAFETAQSSGQQLPCDVGLVGPLMGGLNDPFWKYDAEADVLIWGEELVTAWGYPAAARQCKLAWWVERIHADDRQRVLCEMRAHTLAESTVGVYAYRWQHAQGHYVCVVDRIYRVSNAAGISRVWVGMMVACDWPLLTRVDPKAPPHAQPRPKADEVAPLPSSLLLIDTQRRFVYANQALLHYWHLSMDAVRGRSLEEVIGAEGYALFPHEAPRALEGSFVSFEVPFRAPTGEARWHLINYLPYRDRNAVVQGVVCHITDLHLFLADDDADHDRHRRFSRQYQVLLAELEQHLVVPALDAMTLGASKQRIADLEAQRVVRERFVTMLTHDLRNPLAAARLTAERLVRKGDMGPIDSSAAKPTPAQRLISHLDRADSMITGLLDANRLQSGAQLVIERQRLDLARLIDDVVRDFSLAAERIVLHGPKAPLEGDWDPRAVRRILENLLSNAVKYGDAHRPITVSLSKQDEAALLCVHNWGEPLPRRRRDVLFRPFERTAKAARSGQPGWGIGLALVRGLAQAHNGCVGVTSAQKTGTRFCVTLPGGAAET
jgi:signal transduction histidine kinase